jgi:hypothetical protein
VFQSAQAPAKDAQSTSDGVRVKQIPARPVGPTEWPTPATLNHNLKAGLLRRGCFELHVVSSRMEETSPNPVERLVVSGFKFGDGEEGLRPLVYTLAAGPGKMEVQLWYDAKTLALQKRVTTFPDPSGKPVATITELYKTFTFNAEIPDSTFKLPD